MKKLAVILILAFGIVGACAAPAFALYKTSANVGAGSFVADVKTAPEVPEGIDVTEADFGVRTVFAEAMELCSEKKATLNSEDSGSWVARLINEALRAEYPGTLMWSVKKTNYKYDILWYYDKTGAGVEVGKLDKVVRLSFKWSGKEAPHMDYRTDVENRTMTMIFPEGANASYNWSHGSCDVALASGIKQMSGFVETGKLVETPLLDADGNQIYKVQSDTLIPRWTLAIK